MISSENAKNQIVTFRLTQKDLKKIKEFAKGQDTSVGELIRFCLKPVLVTKQNHDGGK